MESFVLAQGIVHFAREDIALRRARRQAVRIGFAGGSVSGPRLRFRRLGQGTGKIARQWARCLADGATFSTPMMLTVPR
jgi:hypothetical protein